MAFNRNKQSFSVSRNSGPGRGGGFRQHERPRFNDRGPSRTPFEMHKAICDNCGKECEVPFRPTSGKPIYCSSCFENQREGSDFKRSEDKQSLRSNDLRPMFNAVCADCGDNCKVPFQPSGDKPVYCSNCFGEKKNAPGNGSRVEQNSPVLQDKINELNVKLDKILSLLSPAVASEEIIAEVIEKPVKVAKKKASVKKTPIAES